MAPPKVRNKRKILSTRQHMVGGYALNHQNMLSNCLRGTARVNTNVSVLPNVPFTPNGIDQTVDTIVLSAVTDPGPYVIPLTEIPAVDSGMYGVIEYLWMLTPYGRSVVADSTNNTISGRLHCRVSRGTCQGVELVPQVHLFTPYTSLTPRIQSVAGVNTFTLDLCVEAALAAFPLIFSATRTVLLRVTSPLDGYAEPLP